MQPIRRTAIFPPHNVAPKWMALAIGFVAFSASLLHAQSWPSSQEWPFFGQNASNTAASETSISRLNVATLSPKWTFTTGGDVSARAAVVGGVAYFPDWGGNLWALKAATGEKL